jgi:regulatory protein
MEQKITALRQQKKNRQRVSVYLDGDYAFGLQAIIAASLKVGQTLSPEQIHELQRSDLAEMGYERALGFLSYRPRSEAEVVAYLQRRKVPPEAIRAATERLLRAGLLDDEAFSKYWVENREAFRPRGSRLLRFELRRKGVHDAAIAQAIGDLDETESAYRAAQVRARRYARLDRVTFRRRLGGFLQRRGFDYDAVKEAVERLWQEAQVATEEEIS